MRFTIKFVTILEKGRKDRIIITTNSFIIKVLFNNEAPFFMEKRQGCLTCNNKITHISYLNSEFLCTFAAHSAQGMTISTLIQSY
jgi:hypothetical protein